MDNLQPKETALLVHIEHTRPIEMSEFITSLSALNSLYSSYVKNYGDSKGVSQSKLYVDKIEEGSIDIILCELAAASLIPFIENANVIFDFAAHIKQIYDFFTKGGAKSQNLIFKNARI